MVNKKYSEKAELCKHLRGAFINVYRMSAYKLFFSSFGVRRNFSTKIGRGSCTGM